VPRAHAQPAAHDAGNAPPASVTHAATHSVTHAETDRARSKAAIRQAVIAQKTRSDTGDAIASSCANCVRRRGVLIRALTYFHNPSNRRPETRV
jgi:hypothetical protein